MLVIETAISGVWIVETEMKSDHRGEFGRFFCARDLGGILCGRTIVQVNFSRTSAAGAVRGMHYQRSPHAEMKLVRCIRGRVLDVAVDLRRGSPTFLKHHKVELSSSSALMVVIPEGCAHGFQAQEPDSELLYLHTAFYEKGSEGGVRHDDPVLHIEWPLPITEISPRDLGFPLLSKAFEGIQEFDSNQRNASLESVGGKKV